MKSRIAATIGANLVLAWGAFFHERWIDATFWRKTNAAGVARGLLNVGVEDGGLDAASAFDLDENTVITGLGKTVGETDFGGN